MACSELHGREFTWGLYLAEMEEGQGWERRDLSGDSGRSQGKDKRGLGREAGRDTLILENATRMAPRQEGELCRRDGSL